MCFHLCADSRYVPTAMLECPCPASRNLIRKRELRHAFLRGFRHRGAVMPLGPVSLEEPQRGLRITEWVLSSSSRLASSKLKTLPEGDPRIRRPREDSIVIERPEMTTATPVPILDRHAMMSLGKMCLPSRPCRTALWALP